MYSRRPVLGRASQLCVSWCRLRHYRTAAPSAVHQLTRTGGSTVGTGGSTVGTDAADGRRAFSASRLVGASSSQLVPKSIFDEAKEKDKKTFLQAVDMFHEMTVHKRGHVEFIYAALAEMENFGVHKDIEAYRKVLGVFPLGQLVATNVFQVEFQHFPRQQNCAVDVLQQMEDHGVIPDLLLRDQLINIFGKYAFPVRRLARMLYWMPKFRNLSPWLLPKELPADLLHVAQLGIKQITSVDSRSVVTTFEAKDLPADALDQTWIVSGQAILQKKLLEKHAAEQPLFVEGPYRLWLRDQSIGYFVLRAEPVEQRTHEGLDSDDLSFIENWTWKRQCKAIQEAEPPNVHHQEDATVLAVCATGSSSRDSLLSWIRLLQRDNPRLAHIPVLFTLRAPVTDVAGTGGATGADVAPAADDVTPAADDAR